MRHVLGRSPPLQLFVPFFPLSVSNSPEASQSLTEYQRIPGQSPKSLLHCQNGINAQLVHPAASQVVKPNELESALARPLQRAYYRPEASQAELAASLSYGIIKGHPFLDGNKRTAFFLANEYIRAQGHPGLADGGQVGEVYKGLQTVVDQYVGVASGRLEENALANDGAKSKDS